MEDSKNNMRMVEAVQEIIDTLGSGYVISRKELIQFVKKNYGMVEGSIIATDYCYNRINDGIKLSKPTLFEHISRGKYRCLGENYPYNGEVYHKDQVVGFCKNGVREIYGIPREVLLDENPKVQKGREPSTKLRFEVLVRDEFTCRYCGASPTKDSSVTLHIDHIIPWSKGGKTTLDNLQTLCSKCNLGKGDTIID